MTTTTTLVELGRLTGGSTVVATASVPESKVETVLDHAQVLEDIVGPHRKFQVNVAEHSGGTILELVVPVDEVRNRIRERMERMIAGGAVLIPIS